MKNKLNNYSKNQSSKAWIEDCRNSGKKRKVAIKMVGVLLSFSLLFGTLSTLFCFADSETVNKAQVTNYSFAIDKEGVTRLEAEDVDVTNYVISGDNPTKIVGRSDASGGKFLAAATGDVKDSQYFEFKFNLAMNAEIVMSAAYAQTEKKKSNKQDMTKAYIYTIDGSKTVGLSSNYVLQPRTDITQWDTVTYDKFTLSAGEHSVRVRVAENTGKGNPNIDYIDFNVTEKTDTGTINKAEVTNYSFTIDKEGVTRLEAEDVDVTNYVISSNNPTKIVERSDASGGKFLAAATGNISYSQYFEFKFTLSMNAEIIMSAAYAQTEQRKSVEQKMVKSYTYLIDENKTVGLSSNYVLQPREDITKWDTVTYDKFTLPAGEHTVRVRVAENTGNGNPNIDYIDFSVTKLEGELPKEETAPDNDIHTTLQYKYLNDENITNVYAYANGVSELSRPKAIVCDFSSDEGIGEGTEYIIQKSATADFEHPITVTGLTEKKYGFYNLKLGERFYWRGGIDEESIKSSPIHETTVSDQGPRNCYIDGVTNVRDIGGYASSLAENAYIRQGLYYRGANLNGITDKGKAQMKEDLGVRTEIDLRDSYQCLGPYVDGVDYNAVSIPSGTEPYRFEEFANEYKQIFSIIANADEKPVYLHCTAGADRTGIVTFMLLTVCGADYEDIARDYLFTNFSTQGARYIDSEFNNWWSKLDNFEGDTKAEKAKSWMLSKGITDEQVEKIREIFVAGYNDENSEAANHIYDNDCDAICNVCGYIRIITHSYSEEWSKDETNHWHECTVCGDKKDTVAHSGGTATCNEKAICSFCGAPYGDFADHNYIEKAESQYLKSAATCVSKAVYYKSCSVCGVKSTETFEYGEVDPENHKHTEVRDAKKATEQEKGYTGDTWCLDCNTKIAEGKDIEKLEHTPVLVKNEEATASKEGNIEYYYCENCGKYYSDEAGTKEIAKEDTVVAKLAPKIIDGNNAKIDKSSKEPVSFRSDAAFADFIRVELDGKELVKDKDYTLKEGSIIATLTPEFIVTLTSGEHTLGIVSVSGTAVASFTVTADNASNTVSDNNSEKSPQTGDSINIILWSFLVVISLASLCITAIVSKKKKQSR